ncbi:PocR ligand-binding domain-containing protein [Shigella flexneri]|nr:PocR ligand-binding domain-containing protein [Escherichia coli]
MKPSDDIIDKISYDFAYATGLGSVVVDVNGKEISPWYNFTPFCQHVRRLPEFHALCQQCDRCGGLESFKTKKIGCYRCHAGLVDFSIPIIINNNMIGFLACGQARIENSLLLPSVISSNNNIERISKLYDLWQEVPVMEPLKITAAHLLNTIVENYLSKEYDVKVIRGIDGGSHTKSTLNDIQRARIDKIIKYIHDHFSEELTLEKVANVASLSPWYLSRFFKKAVGEGINTYLTRVRLCESHNLLKNTNWSVERISRSVGFNDSVYFSRLFKHNYGASPEMLRKQKE